MAAGPNDEEMPANMASTRGEGEDVAPFLGSGGEETVPPRRVHALSRTRALAAALACVGVAALGASHLLREPIRGSNANNQVAAEGSPLADPHGIVSLASDEGEKNTDSWLPGYAYVNTTYDRDDYEQGLSVGKGDVLLIAEKASEHHEWYFGHKVFPETGGRGYVPKWAVEINSIKIRRPFTANESSDGHTGCVEEVSLGDSAFPRHNHSSGWTWIVAVRSSGLLDVQEGWVPDWALHSS
jgi:hypothetical protein